MPSANRIIERLPSLYRPEPDDPDLYSEFIRAVGTLLDDVSATSSEVMQAHWFGYADSALLSGYLLRFRQLVPTGPIKPGDDAVDDFPYFCSLPRIGTLFDQLPWLDPLASRERVEDFRRRLARLVALYRNGLGTLAALRTISLVTLPVMDRDAPEGLRERPFTVEEFSPTRRVLQQALARGQPSDMVGPLMRWQVSGGRFSVPVSAVIQGVAPIADHIDATVAPSLERFAPLTGTGVALAYTGTLAPGVALALLPAFSSWLGTPGGLQRASAVPQGTESVDITAAGPWAEVTGAPNDGVVAMVQTDDRHVWLAVNGAAGGSLWRSDGTTFEELLTGLPELRCLAQEGTNLLAGFSTGLARLPLYTDAAPAFDSDVGALNDAAVNAITRDASGTLWLATGRGAARLLGDGTVQLVGLGARTETETNLRCVFADDDGTLFFGGDLGAFRFVPDNARWHVYSGADVSEGVNDWLAFDPALDDLPDASTVFLPPVNSIGRGSDAALWFATDRGLARYVARERRRTFTSLLEAYPHITQSAAHTLQLDERGRWWSGTAAGLIVFDGLDWYQAQAGALTRLTREPTALPDPEGSQVRFWRFERSLDRWQRLNPADAAGFRDIDPTPLASAQTAVFSILWSDEVATRLGSFDGSLFTVDDSASPAPVQVRFKPDPLRILDGGVPALPRLLPGTNHFRYLGLEQSTDAVPASRPAWTREGRLLPEPQARAAPWEGRYLDLAGFEDMDRVFAFCPAARVWLGWEPREVLSVTVRLGRMNANESTDPLILDRLFLALNQVRPAGVRVALADGERIVRGDAP